MTHNSTETPTSSHSLKWASKQARVKVKTHATRSIHQQREYLLNTIWKGLNAIRSTWIHILTTANQQPPILFLNLVASTSFRGLFWSLRAKVLEQTSNTSLSMSFRSTFMYEKLSVSPIRLFDTELRTRLDMCEWSLRHNRIQTSWIHSFLQGLCVIGLWQNLKFEKAFILPSSIADIFNLLHISTKQRPTEIHTGLTKEQQVQIWQLQEVQVFPPLELLSHLVGKGIGQALEAHIHLHWRVCGVEMPTHLQVWTKSLSGTKSLIEHFHLARLA